jgi:hypothetical protein
MEPQQYTSEALLVYHSCTGVKTDGLLFGRRGILGTVFDIPEECLVAKKTASPAAKKTARNPTAIVDRVGPPVRLNLSLDDHARLEKCAKAKGLNKASYARMAVLERIKSDESLS